jgi:uncharacterized protein YggE
MRSSKLTAAMALATLISVALFRSEVLAEASMEKTAPPAIRVTAEATVTAAPDQASIEIGVLTQAKDAKTAAAENARNLDAVRAEVRKLLSEKADLQTIGYSVRPNYRYPKEGGKPRIVGYTATNVLRVKTNQLDEVGAVIDAATQAGSNQIQRLQFRLQREDAVRAEALRQAAVTARAKADAIASALDLRVVRVLSVEEGGPAAAPIVRTAQRSMAEGSAQVPTPVEPGTIDVRATITLTVEVVQ